MSHPTKNWSFRRPSSQPISWLSTEKLKQTQQNKHASVTKYGILQHKQTQKTKARFGRLLWPPAWKRRGPILISVLHIFVTYLVTCFDNCPLTSSPGTNTGPLLHWLCTDWSNHVHMMFTTIKWGASHVQQLKITVRSSCTTAMMHSASWCTVHHFTYAA